MMRYGTSERNDRRRAEYWRQESPHGKSGCQGAGQCSANLVAATLIRHCAPEVFKPCATDVAPGRETDDRGQELTARLNSPDPDRLR